MPFTEILSTLQNPSPVVIAAAIVVLLIVSHLGLGLFVKLGRLKSGHLGQLRATVWVLALAIGVPWLALSLPIDISLRAQVLGLAGVAFVALASTTLLGNAIAGILLRIVGNMRTGDWVRVEEQFGRVTERGLFHTEIATEDRDLTTLPNLYLVTKPVTVVRASGTFVTADVSLGYDVGHRRVREVLKKAGAGVTVGDPPEYLQDVFVHVRELGDFSVTYRVGGLLKNVKLLLSARSRLRAATLTGLHESNIEIVSPAFMNTRSLTEEQRILPNSILEKLAARRAQSGQQQPETVLEDVATDKADEAEKEELVGDREADLEADRSDQESRRRQAGVEPAADDEG